MFFDIEKAQNLSELTGNFPILKEKSYCRQTDEKDEKCSPIIVATAVFRRTAGDEAISKFCHTYTSTDSFKCTVFNRFSAYFYQLPEDLCDQLLGISGFSNEHQETFQNSLELRCNLYVITCFKDSHPCWRSRHTIPSVFHCFFFCLW